MNDVKKLLARIGAARDAISRKEEQTGLDFMIDGVLMNCAVMLKEQDAVEPTWQQGKAYCGACGKRIPLKIKSRFCHKCGKPVLWEGRRRMDIPKMGTPTDS